MKTTLYNITKDEARQLIEQFNGDLGVLAIVLWNSGRASNIKSGLCKAKRLKHFIGGLYE